MRTNLSLNAIEVCEIAEIKVMGKKNQLIFEAGNECIWLANLFKVRVQLHWNAKVINVYASTTLEEILTQVAN